MAERVPPLEATIHIDAPPSVVWQIISDQRRMHEWSPETFKQWFSSKEIRRGTRTLNVNKRKGFFWPTASRYVELVPEQRLAFRVHGPGDVWSYELTPDGPGTTLTERRELIGGKRTFLSKVTAKFALGGIAEHDVELKAGMETTLARIKAEAERAA